MGKKRKAVSPKIRFEVFKRDSFKCQYCGRAAPTVVLELEHINPVSKGGSNEILNLITSCWECNSGNGARTLADDAILTKQRDQLEELQARREQIEMMLRWRDSNLDLEEQQVEAFAQAFKQRVGGWSLNDTGKQSARRLLKKHDLARALEALDRAVDYAVKWKDGKVTADSAEAALKMIFIFAEPDDVQSMYRLRARIRRRWNYVHDGQTIGLLRKLLQLGVSVDDVETRVEECMRETNTSFRWWCGEMEEWIAVIKGAQGR